MESNNQMMSFVFLKDEKHIQALTYLVNSYILQCTCQQRLLQAAGRSVDRLVSLLEKHPEYLTEIEYLEAVILAGRANLERYQRMVDLTLDRLDALKSQ